MLNFYANNTNQNKKSYNQISIEKITNLINHSKQRASSINHAKQIKQKFKISPSKLKIKRKPPIIMKILFFLHIMAYQ